jgi:hypothetical protein
MADFSDYLENVIINHILRNQAYTPATVIYLALFSGNTGLETNAPTLEIAGTGYVRQAITLGASTTGTVSHAADIVFPVAGATWLEATHFAIVDHATNITWGSNVNVLMWKILPTPKTAQTGDQLRWTAGALTVTVT